MIFAQLPIFFFFFLSFSFHFLEGETQLFHDTPCNNTTGKIEFDTEVSRHKNCG